MNSFKVPSLQTKRKNGEFFTDSDLAFYSGKKILSLIRIDLVVEPFAGEGTLLEPFIEEKLQCVANEKDQINYKRLKNKFINKNVLVYNEDFISTNSKQIIQWITSEKTAIGRKALFYTNPPFGTVSTNKLARKKTENLEKDQKRIQIEYHGLEKYGKGDLLLPALGKIIEIIQEEQLTEYYLAFFSPLGLFCKRKRYEKLLNSILSDFTFIYGEIFSGDRFQNVNKQKPISLTVWKYEKGINSPITSLSFVYNGNVLPLKPMPLLKNYWKYDTRKRINGEIAVQGNDRFNVVAPKMFHMKVEKGGSEVIPENLIKPLNLKFIPDELAIGLWSVAVGFRSLTNYPLYMDNAYIHLPDFFAVKTQTILTFVLLTVLLIEQKNRYTNGKIGFSEKSLDFRFGCQNLTKGAWFLLEKYKDVVIENETVNSVFEYIKNDEMTEEKTRTMKKKIKNSIEFLLDQIGYWDFIPIPND